MVKIRLLDGPDGPDKEEAFLALEKHGGGFAVVLVDSDGDRIAQPFVLFLEPDLRGKLMLSLASTPNNDFINVEEGTDTIRVNPSH